MSEERRDAGLCSNCVHMLVIRSDRGAVFYRCGLSDTDKGFVKYPVIPVLLCRGWVKAG